MNPAKIRELLEQVQSGSTTVEDALGTLKDLPFADLGYAVVDHHRALRLGVPEVILGEAKTAAQIVGIAGELVRTGQNVLVTRLDAAKAEEVCAAVPAFRYHAMARVATFEQTPIPQLGTRAVAVVSAGTSDLPVAEECGETLRMLGAKVERIYDVGVAGIHRLLHRRQVLDAMGVIIVVAGMEGALASVVGGLVESPVIAVPTSVGYGAALGGIAALLGMLTSCASGITVVNIDNGFGAAFAAARILRAGART
ncbi:nickel pincer cofactor biosynthesis protein LarB [Pendulispora albinea]|uniref:Nickel pincer cofactor biosynthesis protein LarB n=1 Tax=Pendulispora albinea TaxID=2741071 RepID=A0ABZ2M609_9BACT